MMTTATNEFLLDRLSHHASEQPKKQVLTFLNPGLDGGRVHKSLSYFELSEKTTQVAQRLLAVGLKRGER